MKTKMMFASIVIGFASLVVLFMIGPRLAWGQDLFADDLELQPPADPIPRGYGDGYGRDGSMGEYGNMGEYGGRNRSFSNRISQRTTNNEMRKVINKLQTAKSAEEKAGVMKELTSLLDRHFTADMKKREQNIANIEARIQKLRAQFEKRHAAKDKIIKLQLQVLSNEAEGLGFFSPSNGVSSMPLNPPPAVLQRMMDAERTRSHTRSGSGLVN